MKKELDIINKAIANCTACDLHKTRANVVPGEGDPESGIVFFGEAPGQQEDETGRPFVGRAGKMLDSMLASIGLSRDTVFIMNSIKCRPPGNRKPLPDEVGSCRHFFESQLLILKPKLIVALGTTAAESLCGPGPGITRRRGKLEEYNGIPVMPTLHPSYLLRNPAAKTDAWKDFKLIKELLDEKRAI